VTDGDGWLISLGIDAPDIVAAYRGIEAGRFVLVRREVRRRSGPGSAERTGRQLAAIASAMVATIGRLPDRAFAMPGGEADWNVAQAVGHDADARAGLTLAAALAAQGRFPPDARPVVPGVPGSPAALRDELIARIEKSQRLVERAVGRVVGHEGDACPLEHPLVGRLRCGEWLLFAGVHDLMHLDQLHRILARIGDEAVA
jgi:hypothetical protein